MGTVILLQQGFLFAKEHAGEPTKKDATMEVLLDALNGLAAESLLHIVDHQTSLQIDGSA